MALVLVVAGRTAPNRAVRFGGEWSSLDDRGRADVARLTVPRFDAVRIGPEASVVETARILGIHVEPDTDLRSLDVGRWRGLTPEAVSPDELGVWFADPETRPHGGESVSDFVSRIGAATAGFDGLLVVASPVAQAVLAGSVDVFFGVDVRPASVIVSSP